MNAFSDGGSTPPASTKGVLHEHLLFSRRLRCDGVAVIPATERAVKVLRLGRSFSYIGAVW